MATTKILQDFIKVYGGMIFWFVTSTAVLHSFALFLMPLGKAGFETVVLDSRTGITDIGGLLAVLLPHTTVLVGNYGRQNTKGLAHVWQALQPASEGRIAPRGALPPLTRILVASPIADELDLRAKGEEIWKEAFGLAPAELITIPFDQRLLFTEELYAATRPDTPVAKAYNAVSYTHLTLPTILRV